MLKKKTVLIICSWLGISDNVGIFFKEQAELMQNDFHPILVVFEGKGIRNILQNKKVFTIQIFKTDKGVEIFNVTYPAFWFLGKLVNKIFRNYSLNYFVKHLLKHNIKVSLIHAQSMFNAGVWAYQLHKILKVPYINTEHNQLSFYKVSVKKYQLIANSIKNANKNLVVSNDKIRQFAANGIYGEFCPVGNLIHENFIHKDVNHTNTTINFVTIGAFHPIKDQKTIFDALQIIDSKIKCQIEFKWIGYSGWGQNKTSEVNELLNQYDFINVKILTFDVLDRKQVASHLSTANLFLFTSISEGMPVSVLEALACGVPVFTTNCGGVDEIITKSNGIVFQIKDYIKLAELMLQFINKELVYDGKQISKNILEKFGVSVFKEKMVDTYNKAIND